MPENRQPALREAKLAGADVRGAGYAHLGARVGGGVKENELVLVIHGDETGDEVADEATYAGALVDGSGVVNGNAHVGRYSRASCRRLRRAGQAPRGAWRRSGRG